MVPIREIGGAVEMPHINRAGVAQISIMMLLGIRLDPFLDLQVPRQLTPSAA